MKKIKCGYKIKLISEVSNNNLKNCLIEIISQSTFRETDKKIKIPGKRYFGKVEECFRINCQNQICINEILYCYNQTELKKIYNEN